MRAATPHHHALAVAMAALALLVCVEGAVDLGLSFNETMAGYYTAGDLDFQQAYDQGKASGRNMHFTCHVTIPHMQQFVADPDHASKIDGVIFITELTNFPGVTFQGGVLNVFNRSVDFQELEMAYFIPFVGLDGNQYHLEGLKHIRGAECIHLLAMSTTLYSHVRKGWVDGQGDIISTGIVIIDIIRVIELVESMRVVGNGTDADKLDMFFNFASFLLSQVSKDCLNSTNWESQFWYIWGSDGSNGFLLDMVARPDTLELRLETYIKGQTPIVTKQYLNVEQLSVFAHGAVSFGNVLTMSETGCQGSVGNLSVNATYDVTYATNDFVPIILYAALQGLLPEIESKYGVLTSAAKIGNVTLAASTPLVHTTYTFKVGLKLMQWCMISAMQFVGTDLKVEAIGMHIPDAGFLGTAFVHYNGKQYQLNDPVTAAVSVVTNGSAIVNNTRTITFTIVYKHEVNLEVQCSAPASAFALLDKEGNTEIHTTVLGQCRAVDNVGALAFNSVPSALMEIKQTV